jgi:hypothetical protein
MSKPLLKGTILIFQIGGKEPLYIYIGKENHSFKSLIA